MIDLAFDCIIVSLSYLILSHLSLKVLYAATCIPGVFPENYTWKHGWVINILSPRQRQQFILCVFYLLHSSVKSEPGLAVLEVSLFVIVTKGTDAFSRLVTAPQVRCWTTVPLTPFQTCRRSNNGSVLAGGCKQRAKQTVF